MNKEEFAIKMKELEDLEREQSFMIRCEAKKLTDEYIEENKPFNVGTVIELDGERGIVTGFRCPRLYSQWIAGYWRKYLKNGQLSNVERKLTAADLEDAKIIEKR